MFVNWKIGVVAYTCHIFSEYENEKNQYVTFKMVFPEAKSNWVDKSQFPWTKWSLTWVSWISLLSMVFGVLLLDISENFSYPHSRQMMPVSHDLFLFPFQTIYSLLLLSLAAGWSAKNGGGFSSCWPYYPFCHSLLWKRSLLETLVRPPHCICRVSFLWMGCHLVICFHDGSCEKTLTCLFVYTN